MRFTDLDWRVILNGFSETDILYLKSICEEKLAHMPRRKILIKSED
jgi:hypothetical protein